MKIAIVNYGMGNLSSVHRAFEDLGVDPLIANHPSALYDANRIVLPGVGAFTEGMAHLHQGGWVEALRELVGEHGKPMLGICLGMQMLADEGYEGGVTSGLGLIPGQVRRLDELGCTLRIPHVGWNEVNLIGESLFFKDVPSGTDFYFVHSYAFVPEQREHLLACASYDVELTAVVRRKHVFGCQFHPEKSSKAGRLLLRNFLNYSSC